MGSDRRALKLMVDALRPRGGEDASARLRALTRFLETGDPELGERIGGILRAELGGLHIFWALTESGVGGHRSLPSELLNRVGNRIAPAVPDPADLRDAILELFSESDDYRWVNEIADEDWRQLLTALGVTAEAVDSVPSELGLALRVAAHHAASLGLQPVITDRLHLIDEGGTPFLRLGDCVIRYLKSLESGVESNEDDVLPETIETLARCREAVERLREEKGKYGTSLELTGLSSRLLRRLERVELLLHLTAPIARDFQGSCARLLKAVLRAEQTRTRLLPPIKESADLLAVQIVEQAAKKGSKYITSGRRDYSMFLLTSMGGGFIVGLFALAKVVLAGWSMPIGIEALVFGVNYALCFVLILLTGSTLATKQPAMTAATVARSLGEGGKDMQGLEDLVVRVWRSQFISFVGNVVIALPLAFLVSKLFLSTSGGSIASPEKATGLLRGLDPLNSGTVFYAAIAGVFLFLSGLIAGWVGNWSLHQSVPDRVRHHPLLLGTVGARVADRTAEVVDQKLGALTGNVFLGFALGSMGSIGAILGLPLDIRHIAFSSAELGLSLEVLGGSIPSQLLVSAGIGVLVIGLINFLVSFGLSLLVALESRGVTFRQMRTLPIRLGRRLLRTPLDWFLPIHVEGKA